MKPITIFTGATGLNTKVDPTRIKFDPDTGITDLAVAVDVDIDDTGRISRRRGYESRLSGAYHSLFCSGGTALAVIGDALGIVATDVSGFTALRNVTVGARMSYRQAFNGHYQEIYYANGYEKGIVRNGSSHAWVAGDYVGPDTTKTFSDPPIGHLLGLYNGRMYIAQDKVLWYSEPFAYSWYDLARNYIPFDSRIRFIAEAQDGLFIGTETAVFALTGPGAGDFSLKKVVNAPAIEGTVSQVDASAIGSGEILGLWPMFATGDGICLGTQGGQVFNLTSSKIDMPVSSRGCSLVFNDKYFCVVEE